MKLREQLKKETQQDHFRLHHHPLLSTLTQSNILLKEYILVLKIFNRFYLALQKQILASGNSCNLLENCLNNLITDLKNLNVKNDLPECKLDMTIKTYDDYLGILYVVQGAHLGGQFIAKNIRHILGIEPNSGLLFFTGNGKDTAAKWHNFLLILENTFQDKDSVIKTACAVFENFEYYLQHIYESL